MHREGHVGVALLAYAPVGALTLALGFGHLALLGAGGAVVLAMLPDYDQRVPGLEHRGPTHTVWFALAVGAVLGVFGGLSGAEHGLLSALALAVWASVVGVATVGSHIVADALTPAGVRPLAPYRNRHYSYDLARARNPLANYALLALGVLAAGAALALVNFLAA